MVGAAPFTVALLFFTQEDTMYFVPVGKLVKLILPLLSS
jgi:hypothetical protein